MLQQIAHAFLFLRELIERSLTFGRFAERVLLGFVERLDFLRGVLLLMRELAGLSAHVAKIVGELARILFAQLLAHLLQLPLRARAGGKRLRDRAVARRL